jgi:Ca-activated chloride channel family protein
MHEHGQLGTARAGVLAAASALRPDDRLGVFVVGAQAQEIVPLAGDPGARALARAFEVLDDATPQKPAADLGLPAVFRSLDPARSPHLVALSTGVLPGSEPALFELLAHEAATGRRTSAVGVGERPYDDGTLERLAHAGRGRYAFVDDPDDVARVLEHARLPVVAIAPRVTVRFDPAAVTLYRLIGYESRTADRSGDGPGREPSVLVAGDTATALYELALADDAPSSWGEAELHYTAPAGGRPQTVTVRIENVSGERELPRAGADMLLAAIAAGTAEKLRASYWARRMQWSELATLHRKLPVVVRKRADVAELGRMIDSLGKLDQRGDRYESRFPQARMDFDRLPVIE